MTIVNTIYPSDDSTFDLIIGDLNAYITSYSSCILKSSSIKNAEISNAVKYTSGFDILIAFFKSEELFIAAYTRNKDFTVDGFTINKINIKSNSYTQIMFVIGSPSADNITGLTDPIKQSIHDILTYNLDFSRLITDEIGTWYHEANTVDNIYMDCIGKVVEPGQINAYMFNEDGYIRLDYPKEKFIFLSEDAIVYVGPCRILGSGWILYKDGKWHLIGPDYYTELLTVIDGKIYYLDRYGMLDEDASLFEIDPDDKYVLHKKSSS